MRAVVWVCAVVLVRAVVWVRAVVRRIGDSASNCVKQIDHPPENSRFVFERGCSDVVNEIKEPISRKFRTFHQLFRGL
jgi:hypothetical protein